MLRVLMGLLNDYTVNYIIYWFGDMTTALKTQAINYVCFMYLLNSTNINDVCIN